jgi:hypothetical protein
MLGIADAGTAMPMHSAAAILIARVFLKQAGYPRTSMTVSLSLRTRRVSRLAERSQSTGNIATTAQKIAIFTAASYL